MTYLLLIIGFILLIKGADFFVDGAASIAYQFHIPTVIVGLTIVALGTSLPELAVSTTAALAGSNSLALSNVTGSNIFNTLIVVGVSALICPFVINKEVINRDLAVNIGVTLLLAAFAMTGMINWVGGVIFLVILACYLYWLIKSAIQHPTEDDDEKKIISPLLCALYIVFGALAIGIGGDMTVDSAKKIALDLGMSETLIGLTIVAFGTSLPELVTSVVAARKGESGLSIGNAIGSNILNILFILGTSSILHPLSVSFENVVDIWILFAVAVVMYFLARYSKIFGRWQGSMMIFAYCLYMIYAIWR